ncbi:MAG: hypothetical protein QOG07_3544 [Pseudonocardiales bacterium]|nr:hypothetical protein [Pseudonocardiales bacterium]
MGSRKSACSRRNDRVASLGWVTGRKAPARTDLLVRLGRRGDAAAAYAQAIAGTANETEQRFLRRRLGATTSNELVSDAV